MVISRFRILNFKRYPLITNPILFYPILSYVILFYPILSLGANSQMYIVYLFCRLLRNYFGYLGYLNVPSPLEKFIILSVIDCLENFLYSAIMFMRRLEHLRILKNCLVNLGNLNTLRLLRDYLGSIDYENALSLHR